MQHCLPRADDGDGKTIRKMKAKIDDSFQSNTGAKRSNFQSTELMHQQQQARNSSLRRTQNPHRPMYETAISLIFASSGGINGL